MDLQRAVSKLLSGRLLNAGLEFAAVAGFTQLFGTSAVGSFFLFQTLIGLVGIPGDLGVSKAAEKTLSTGEPSGTVLASGILLKILLLAPWIVLALVFRSVIDSYVGVQGVAILVIAGFVANQFRRFLIRVLAGRMQIEKTAIIKVSGILVWVIISFLGIYLMRGSVSIILGFVIGDVVIILASATRLDVEVGRPRVTRMKSLLTFGRNVSIGSVGGYVYSWMDVAILRLFVSPTIIGAYEIAWRVAALSMMVTNAIGESLFPKISKLHAEDKLEDISDILYQWIQPPLFVTIPAFVGAVVLGNTVLTTLFSPQATIAYSVLLLFMAEKVFRSINMVWGSALFAIDKAKFGYRGSVVAIAVNLVLNPLLIPVFGIQGAAAATTLSAMASLVVNLRYLNQFISITFPWHRIGWAFASSMVMGLVIFGLKGYLPPGLASLVVGVGAGIGIFLLLILTNGEIKADLEAAIP